MSKFLVIVESPNKVATIKKYLGDDFQVEASVGHIARMRTSGEHGLGIDIEKWEPLYIIEKEKKEVVKKLKTLAKKAKKVYIATDPDREGEAIGDHLVEYLDVKEKYSRVKYNEITKDAILKAFSNPLLLDENLVNAQKARRMLDRVIGFRLSQLMKQKMTNTPAIPSAGRVQSISLKLVVDRENEIKIFVPENYHKLEAKLIDGVSAYYVNQKNLSNKRDWILPSEKQQIEDFFNKSKKTLLVSKIEISEKKNSAVVPLKQAVLYRKSQYNSSITQSVAQKLYEGYGEGGLITYPRTDSTRLSQTFLDYSQNYIIEKWGKEYIASEIKGIQGDQDAHEAIRPTDISLTPEKAKITYPEMSDYELNVYKLIYFNTLKAIMSVPIRINKTYTFLKNSYTFKSTFSTVKFKGYYIIDNNYEVDKNDPNYKEKQEVKVNEFVFSDHQTKPKPRYSEGSLIEALDNIKVGRPSTFATTVKIIKDREYVTNENQSLVPTEFGTCVLEKLTTSFSNIINESYTAQVEEELDLISENKLTKEAVMQQFWNKFNETLSKAKDTMEKTALTPLVLEEACPDDNAELLVRRNKKGQKFAGCSNFPNCKFTKTIEGQNNKKSHFRRYSKK